MGQHTHMIQLPRLTTPENKFGYRGFYSLIQSAALIQVTTGHVAAKWLLFEIETVE